MPTTNLPDWQQIALYAVLGALLIMFIQRIPYVGRIFRFVFSLALLALGIFLLIQQAPYQPSLQGFAGRIGLDRQQVVGEEVRIRMSSDGHFWADARVNGIKRRMLIDSGATVTAISDQTAEQASVKPNAAIVPVVLRTANGTAPAQTATVEELRVGNITATNLKVVTSPALGNMDVLGMNFLSKLGSWRVERNTLIMVPEKTEARESAG
jgi:aspartyl protease family protein